MELSHLLDSQWKNGLLPQIVFNPNFSEYFPGVGFWHAERSPDATVVGCDIAEPLLAHARAANPHAERVRFEHGDGCAGCSRSSSSC